MATKVSVYLDQKTIERLRQRAVRERGTMKSLSKEIEELVRESFVTDELEATVVEWGGDGPVAVAFGDIRPLKVSPGPSVTRMIREEREHRHEGPSRRKRRA
jgi:hypothetical protein